MPKQILFYREVLPLIPDSVWYTSKEVHELLLTHYPSIKLGNVRVALHLWEKKGLFISKPICAEDEFLNIRGPRLYRKATSEYRGHSLGTMRITEGQRKCLSCQHRFWPAHKYNFMCAACTALNHD